MQAKKELFFLAFVFKSAKTNNFSSQLKITFKINYGEKICLEYLKNQTNTS